MLPRPTSAILLALAALALVDHPVDCTLCLPDRISTSSSSSELSFAFPPPARERSRGDSRPASPATQAAPEPNPAPDRSRPNRSVDWLDLKPIMAAHAGLSSDLSDPDMVEALIATAAGQIGQADPDCGQVKSLIMFAALSGVCQPACLDDRRLAPLYRLLDVVTDEPFARLANWAEILAQLCPHLTRMAQIMDRDALWSSPPDGEGPEPGPIALLNDRLCRNPTVFAEPAFAAFVADLAACTFASDGSRLRFVRSYGRFAVGRPSPCPSWLSPRIVFAGLQESAEILALIPELLVVMTVNWACTDDPDAAFLADLRDFAGARDLGPDIVAIVAGRPIAAICSAYGLSPSLAGRRLGLAALYLVRHGPGDFLDRPTTPALLHAILVQCEIALSAMAPIVAASLDRMPLDGAASFTRAFISDKSDLSFFDCALIDQLIRRRSAPKDRRLLWRSALAGGGLDALVRVYQSSLIDLIERNGIASVLFYWFAPGPGSTVAAHEAELALIRMLALNNRPDLLRGPHLDRLLSDSDIDIGVCPIAVLNLLLHTVDYYPELHWRLSPRVTQIILAMTSWDLDELLGKRSPVPASNRDVLLDEADLVDCPIDHERTPDRAGYAWKLHDRFGNRSHDDAAAPAAAGDRGSRDDDAMGAAAVLAPARPGLSRSRSGAGAGGAMSQQQRQRRRQFALELVMQAIELNPGPVAAAFHDLGDGPGQAAAFLGDVLDIMLDQYGVPDGPDADLGEKVVALHSAAALDVQRPNRLVWLKQILLASSLPSRSFAARHRALFALRQSPSAFLDAHSMQVRLLIDRIPDGDFARFPDDVGAILYQILLLTAKGRWSKSYPRRLVVNAAWAALVRDPLFVELAPRLDLMVTGRLLPPIRASMASDGDGDGPATAAAATTTLSAADRSALAWVLVQPLGRSDHVRFEHLETVARLLGLDVDLREWRSDADGNGAALCVLLLHVGDRVASSSLAAAAAATPWDRTQIGAVVTATIESCLGKGLVGRLFQQPALAASLFALLSPDLGDHGQRRFVKRLVRDLPYPADRRPGWPVLHAWLRRAIQGPSRPVRDWVAGRLVDRHLPVDDGVKAAIRSMQPGTSTAAALPESPSLSRSGSVSSIVG